MAPDKTGLGTIEALIIELGLAMTMKVKHLNRDGGPCMGGGPAVVEVPLMQQRKIKSLIDTTSSSKIISRRVAASRSDAELGQLCLSVVAVLNLAYQSQPMVQVGVAGLWAVEEGKMSVTSLITTR